LVEAVFFTARVLVHRHLRDKLYKKSAMPFSGHWALSHEARAIASYRAATGLFAIIIGWSNARQFARAPFAQTR
jgi:hypothetical protein